MTPPELSPEMVEARALLLSDLMEKHYGLVRVDVSPTAALRGLARVRPGTASKEFKHGLFMSYARSYIVPLAVALILVSILTLGQFVYWMIIIGVLMIVTSLIADNRRGHCIHIDDKNLTVEGSAFAWNDIAGTAILTATLRADSRSPDDIYYLLVVFRQGGYRQFDLGKYHAFWGLRTELARYIEFFKATASAPGAG